MPFASPQWPGPLWVSTAPASQPSGSHKNVTCRRCQNSTSQMQVTTPNSSRFPARTQIRNMGRAVRNWPFLSSAFTEPWGECPAACSWGRAVVAGSPLPAGSRYEQFLTCSESPAGGSPPSQLPDLVFGVG